MDVRKDAAASGAGNEAVQRFTDIPSLVAAIDSTTTRLIVLVGLPGCGKSTFTVGDCVLRACGSVVSWLMRLLES